MDTEIIQKSEEILIDEVITSWIIQISSNVGGVCFFLIHKNPQLFSNIFNKLSKDERDGEEGENYMEISPKEDVVTQLLEMISTSKFEGTFNEELLQKSDRCEWRKLFVYLILLFEARVPILKTRNISQESQYDLMIKLSITGLEKYVLKRLKFPDIFPCGTRISSPRFSDGSGICYLIHKFFPDLVDVEDIWLKDSSSSDVDDDDLFYDEDDEESHVSKVDSQKVITILTRSLRLFRLDYLLEKGRLLRKDQGYLCALLHFWIIKNQVGRVRSKHEMKYRDLAAKVLENSQSAKDEHFNEAVAAVEKALYLSSNHYYYLSYRRIRAELLQLMKRYKESICDFRYVWKYQQDLNVCRSIQEMCLKIAKYDVAMEFYKHEKQLHERSYRNEKMGSENGMKSIEKSHQSAFISHAEKMIKLCNKALEKVKYCQYMQGNYMSSEFEFITSGKEQIKKRLKSLLVFSIKVVNDVFPEGNYVAEDESISRRNRNEESSSNHHHHDEECEGEEVEEEEEEIEWRENKMRSKQENQKNHGGSNVKKNFFSIQKMNDILRLLEMKVNLFFIGPTKSGKSTGINRVLDKNDFLPTNDNTCTSCLTYVRHIEDGGDGRTKIVEVFKKKLKPPVKRSEINEKAVKSCLKGEICSFLATGVFRNTEIDRNLGFYRCKECGDLVCCKFCSEKCHTGHTLENIPPTDIEEGKIFCHCFSFTNCTSKNKNMERKSMDIESDWKSEVNQERNEESQFVEFLNERVDVFEECPILKYSTFLDSPGVSESEEMMKIVSSRFDGNPNDSLVFVFNGINTIDSYWEDFFEKHRMIIQNIRNPIVVVATRLHNYFGSVANKEAEFRGKLSRDSMFGDKKFELFFIESKMESDDFNLDFERLLEYRERFANFKKHLFDIIIEGSLNIYQACLRKYEQELSKIYHLYLRIRDLSMVRGHQWMMFQHSESKYLKELGKGVMESIDTYRQEKRVWRRFVFSGLEEFWKSSKTLKKVKQIARETFPELKLKSLIAHNRCHEEYSLFQDRVNKMYQEFCRGYMVEIIHDLLKRFRISRRKMGKVIRAEDVKYYETTFVTHGMEQLVDRVKRIDVRKKTVMFAGSLLLAPATQISAVLYVGSLVVDMTKSQFLVEEPAERLAKSYIKSQKSRRVLNDQVEEFLSSFHSLWMQKIDRERDILESEKWFFEEYIQGKKVPKKAEKYLVRVKQKLDQFYEQECLDYLAKRYSLDGFSILKHDMKKKKVGFGSFGNVYSCQILTRDKLGKINKSDVKASKVVNLGRPGRVVEVAREAFLLSLNNSHKNLLQLQYFAINGERKQVETFASTSSSPKDTSSETSVRNNNNIIESSKKKNKKTKKEDIFVMKSAALVTELYEGTLEHFLRLSKPPQLTLDHRKIVIDSIVDGMINLHSRGIVHRDLKPSNILIRFQPEFRVVLCDFGGSKDRNQMSGTFVGSPGFCPPEILRGTNMMYTETVDVYSFGMILFSVLSHTQVYVPPIYSRSHTFGISDLDHQNLEVSFGSRVWRKVKELVNHCVRKNPSGRPSFEEIKERWAVVKEDIQKFVVVSHFNLYSMRGVEGNGNLRGIGPAVLGIGGKCFIADQYSVSKKKELLCQIIFNNEVGVIPMDVLDPMIYVRSFEEGVQDSFLTGGIIKNSGWKNLGCHKLERHSRVDWWDVGAHIPKENKNSSWKKCGKYKFVIIANKQLKKCVRKEFVVKVI